MRLVKTHQGALSRTRRREGGSYKGKEIQLFFAWTSPLRVFLFKHTETVVHWRQKLMCVVEEVPITPNTCQGAHIVHNDNIKLIILGTHLVCTEVQVPLQSN